MGVSRLLGALAAASILFVAQTATTYEDVRLLTLIARPGLFDGRLVRTRGFLRLEFEGNAIYARREDLDHRSYPEPALWVVVNDQINAKRSEINLKRVIVEGRIDAKDTGHMDAFRGAITDITRIVPDE